MVLAVTTYYVIVYAHSLRTFEVVIARYYDFEYLDWVDKEFPNEKITIYNKGLNNLTPSAHWKVINIPNLGRESHTYLYHIVTNYYNLADRTFFTQGRPDHEVYLPLIEYKTRIFRESHNICKNIIAPCGYYFNGSTKLLTPKDKTEIAKYKLDHMSLDLYLNRHSNVFRKGIADDSLQNFLYTVIGRKLPTDTTIGGVGGAIFAVDKETILQHSREYYQRLLDTLDNVHPEEGFYFEKLWDVIFDNGKYKDIDEVK